MVSWRERFFSSISLIKIDSPESFKKKHLRITDHFICFQQKWKIFPNFNLTIRLKQRRIVSFDNHKINDRDLECWREIYGYVECSACIWHMIIIKFWNKTKYVQPNYRKKYIKLGIHKVDFYNYDKYIITNFPISYKNIRIRIRTINLIKLTRKFSTSNNHKQYRDTIIIYRYINYNLDQKSILNVKNLI